MADNARRCSARRKDGRPCQAWAVHGSQPPLCASHRKPAAGDNQDAQAFDLHAYTLDELADHIYLQEEKSLRDELRFTQAGVLAILRQWKLEKDRDEFARLLTLLFNGARTITGIIRAQEAAAKRDKDELPAHRAAALADIGAEWGLDL
jgi:hypothetical protein